MKTTNKATKKDASTPLETPFNKNNYLKSNSNTTLFKSKDYKEKIINMVNEIDDLQILIKIYTAVKYLT